MIDSLYEAGDEPAHDLPKGAHIVEGYPLDMESPQLTGQNLRGYAGFMGIASVYREAGFVEVGRASETQLIMRCIIDQLELQRD